MDDISSPFLYDIYDGYKNILRRITEHPHLYRLQAHTFIEQPTESTFIKKNVWQLIKDKCNLFAKTVQNKRENLRIYIESNIRMRDPFHK